MSVGDPRTGQVTNQMVEIVDVESEALCTIAAKNNLDSIASYEE